MEIYLIKYPENISFGKEKSPEKKKFTKDYLKNIFKRYYHLNLTNEDFGKNENGKPYLKRHSLYFNLSHSGSHLIIAIGKKAIGIDIERRKELDVLALSKRFFHPEEYRLILNAGEKERQDLFFRLWTHKEAYIKWRGGSLPADLQVFRIVLADDLQSEVYDGKGTKIPLTFKEYRWEDYYITVCSGDAGMPDDFVKIH